tara:strand:+ start:513 stop:941 length:429 start_codon:yes stop_codon:yes gene_type:complete
MKEILSLILVITSLQLFSQSEKNETIPLNQEIQPTDSVYIEKLDKSYFIGKYIQENDSLNISHILSEESWIIVRKYDTLIFSWEHIDEIIKQPNNQPFIIHDQFELINSQDTLRFDIISNIHDTLFLYNFNETRPWKLIKSD